MPTLQWLTRDRLDALVWAITAMMSGRTYGGPRIRLL